MDNKEYRENQKKQKKSLKKYRRHIIKAAIFGGIAIASAFLFPTGLVGVLKGLLGDYIGGSVAFFTQWGLAGAGIIGATSNVIKANVERNKIEKSQDEEEDIVDCIINENDNLERKVNNLEKQKDKTINKDNTKSNDRVVKIDNSLEYEEENQKKYTK